MLAGVAVLGLLALAGILPPVPGAMGASPSVPGGLAIASGGCSGSAVPANLTGRVYVVGAPSSPPSVAGVTVEETYYYQMDYVPSGGSSTLSCVGSSASNVTNASGGFRLAATLPSSSCDRVSCTYYSGPFSPLAFSTPNGTPPGYYLTSSRSASVVRLDFVAALSSVALSPWGRITVSTLAPTAVHANATDGAGRPSPATVSYAWRVGGTGWSVVSGQGNATVRVEGTTGGASGTLTLWTNGTYGGGTTDLPAQTLLLDPVATSVTSQSVSPTSLDAGGAATFAILGSGAGGYAYTATVLPGLGGAAVTVPCTTTPTLGGTVSVSCRALVTFPSAGVAQPSANLTNGFSTAVASFATVEVADALDLALGPDPALGYASAPVPVSLSVAASTGTPPFGPACLWLAAGSATCSTSPGPSWAFSPAFASPGSYALRGTVEDATGANATAGTVVLVFARPALGSIAASTNALPVGGTVELSATIAGGALPIAYWWNDSLPQGTDASGLSAQDGSLSAGLTLLTPGTHTITLSARDALGTTVASATTVVVLPGPAVALVEDGPGPSPSTVAGAPWDVSLCAVGATGACLTGFSTNLSLSPAPGEILPSPLWVNASGFALSASGNGSVRVPYTAWTGGFLNLSVTSLRSGTLSFLVVASLPFTAGPDGLLEVSVGPSVTRPTLSDPIVVHPGSRSNATEYAIADPYGNPIRSGFVIVRTVFGGVQSDLDSPVRANGSGGFVWVNFSAPVGESGVVYVLSAWDVALLPALAVPTGAAASDLTLPVLAAAGGLAAIGVLGGLLARRRRRPSDGPESASAEVGEEELRRVAEGRAHVLRCARGDRRMTLDELAEGFHGPAPTRVEVAEWVSGLVAEGALRASPGPDGEPRFVAVERVEPVTPRVEVDPALLEAALGRRPAREGTDGGDGDAPPGDPSA